MKRRATRSRKRFFSGRLRPLFWPVLLLALTCCSIGPSIIEQDIDGISSSIPAPSDINAIPDAVPKKEPRSRYGNAPSYVVLGKRYQTLKQSRGYRERGIASWYGSKFHGRRTSSGEIYNMYGMSAAHKSLPLPTYARVTNLRNGRSVVVKINDRGPFHANRLIDLSYTAAYKLGIVGRGTGLVEIEAITPGAPTKPPKRPARSKPKGNPSLFLQVGAFGNQQNARRLQQRILSQLDTPVQIRHSSSEQQPVYRVQIGPIPNVEGADRLAQHLDELGIHDSHVVIR